MVFNQLVEYSMTFFAVTAKKKWDDFLNDVLLVRPVLQS